MFYVTTINNVLQISTNVLVDVTLAQQMQLVLTQWLDTSVNATTVLPEMGSAALVSLWSICYETGKIYYTNFLQIAIFF